MHPYIKDSKVEVCSRGGGRSTVNLERICEDIARITSDNVDPRGVNQWSTWKGSAKTLQRLPLTMLILGGQSTVNFERICEDIARITSDNVDWGVDRRSTWKGFAKTLQGLPLTMLILGGVDRWSTWKGSAKTLQ